MGDNSKYRGKALSAGELFGWDTTYRPCKECTERHVGCHSECEKYAKFRELLMKGKAAQRYTNRKRRLEDVHSD